MASLGGSLFLKKPKCELFKPEQTLVLRALIAVGLGSDRWKKELKALVPINLLQKLNELLSSALVCSMHRWQPIHADNVGCISYLARRMVLYFEFIYGRSCTRWIDYEKKHNRTVNPIRRAFLHRLELAKQTRFRSPMYASYEEDQQSRKSHWNH